MDRPTAGATTSSGTATTGYYYIMSSDEVAFRMSTVSASFSGVIQRKLEQAQQKNENRVVLEGHDDKTLKPVTKYLDLRGDEKAEEFLRGKNPKIGKLLQMLLTAQELEIPGMMDAVAEKIASKMANKSVEWVRAAFGIEGNLTEAEEKEIMDQYPWAFQGVVDQEGEDEDEDEDEDDD